MPKYSLTTVDPKGRLASTTRKKTVVTNNTRKHFLKTFKRIQRQKAKEGRKYIKTMRSFKKPNMSIFRKLTHTCENIDTFADFLALNKDELPMYDRLEIYIDGINNLLTKNLEMYILTIHNNNDMMKKIPSDDLFKRLVALSQLYEDIGRNLLEQSTSDKTITPMLQDLTKFIKKIYKKLTDALESFEGELQLASTPNEENSNNSGLNAVMSKFRNLGLGK